MPRGLRRSVASLTCPARCAFPSIPRACAQAAAAAAAAMGVATGMAVAALAGGEGSASPARRMLDRIHSMSAAVRKRLCVVFN
jgi:hypothetical protein